MIFCKCLSLILSLWTIGLPLTNAKCVSIQTFFQQIETFIQNISIIQSCSTEDCNTLSCFGTLNTSSWYPNYSFSIKLNCGEDIEPELKVQFKWLFRNDGNTSTFVLTSRNNNFELKQPPSINQLFINATIKTILKNATLITTFVKFQGHNSRLQFQHTFSGTLQNLNCDAIKSTTTTKATTPSTETTSTTISTPKYTTTTSTEKTTTTTTTTATTSTRTTTPSMTTTSTMTTMPSTPTKLTTNTTSTVIASNKSKEDSHSKAAKILLIVLAVLIVIAVLGMFFYIKQKRRLSDQPAYYNDIAMNDPLRDELNDDDDDNGLYNGRDKVDEDDELPLFA